MTLEYKSPLRAQKVSGGGGGGGGVVWCGTE